MSSALLEKYLEFDEMRTYLPQEKQKRWLKEISQAKEEREALLSKHIRKHKEHHVFEQCIDKANKAEVKKL